MLVRVYTAYSNPCTFDRNTHKLIKEQHFLRKKIWEGNLSFLPRIDDKIVIGKGLDSHRVISVIEYLYDNSVDIEILNDYGNCFDRYSIKRKVFQLNKKTQKTIKKQVREKNERENVNAI